MSGQFKCRYCGHVHDAYAEACLHCEAKGGLVPLAALPSRPLVTGEPLPISDAIIERVLTTRIPGGSQVWWSLDGGGMEIGEHHRVIARRVLEAYELARHEGVR